MQLCLKVDVDTLRGTLEGVPALVRLFDRYQVRGSFLFSLGPDHTGRALRRVFRPGFFGKVQRTSVVSHYGIRTLLYGTLLPGPDIGRKGRAAMRAVAEAGHEVGVHAWDHVRWQDFVTRRDEAWTVREFDAAMAAFVAVFGQRARTCGAAGWQLNRFVPQLEQAAGLDYASDCRGTHPFMPAGGGCPQLPTTLPTLDELLGADGWNESNVHQRLLRDTEAGSDTGHVFTLHAEMEGMKLMPVLQRLLDAWRAQGYQLGPTEALFASLDPAALPRHEILQGTVPGRSGELAVQGPAVA